MSKKLTQKQFLKAVDFIKKNSRPIDKAVFEWYFKNGSEQKVVDELAKFQNSDGGFGNGIEPDIRSELSSPIATTYAIQYLEQLKMTKAPSIIEIALKYFDKTFIKDTSQWFGISSEINEAPHAPWWSFNKEKSKSDENWGNPTVEILGYIAKYGDIEKYQDVFDKSIKRLKTKENIETHELQCYFRFYNCLSEDKKELIKKDLFDHIEKTIETDPTQWKKYVTKPLTFVDSSASPLFKKFSTAIPHELDMIIDSQGHDGGWTPSWEWSTHTDVWEKVKIELTGLITIENLILLDKFERLEN